MADVSPRLSPLRDVREEKRLRLSERNSMLMTQNLSGILSEALIGRRSSFIVHFTDKRQKATKVKCKRDESLTKQSIFVENGVL